MRTYYLQTLEGAPHLGEVSREEIETYFDVCLEAHSEDPGSFSDVILAALDDVGARYGLENVPLAFWHVRNMGRTGYYAVDLYNELHPEQVDPEPEEPVEFQQQTEEGNSMTEDEEINYLQFQEKTPTVDLQTQLVTSGSEFTVIDETDETISYVDETGALHVEQKAKSGLGWLIAAAAAFFLLG